MWTKLDIYVCIIENVCFAQKQIKLIVILLKSKIPNIVRHVLLFCRNLTLLTLLYMYYYFAVI
jgi:hypothetical protein